MRSRPLGRLLVVLFSLSGLLAVAQGLPSPWSDTDIGTGGLAGSASYSSGTFTVSGSGVVWGYSDSTFHFVYQAASGDVQIIARVLSVQNTNQYAKAGVMIRSYLNAGSPNAYMLITPTNGAGGLQYRSGNGGPTATAATGISVAPYWVKLIRVGNNFTGFSSADGINWNVVSTTSIGMSSTIYVGLAVSANDNTLVNTSTFDNVSVTPLAGPPSPWVQQDIGSGIWTGAADSINGMFMVSGSGVVWNSTDTKFHFVYQQVSGDAEIVARVSAIQNTDAWAKSGVMIRESLAANSANVFTALSPVNGAFLQYRSATGGSSNNLAPVTGAAPYWVKLVRSGNNFTGYASSDGTTWVQVGSATVNMASIAYIGLAVSSNNSNLICTSTLDNVAVSPNPTPSPWSQVDIGTNYQPGTASFSNGAWTVRANSTDIWNNPDGFHFVYQPWTGDADVIVRVTSVQDTGAWPKAGIMIRETLTSNSTHVFCEVSPENNGVNFQYRAGTGSGGAGGGSIPGVTTPYWCRLIRRGNTFWAYASADGTSWTILGSHSITMAASVYVGLALSSWSGGLNTSTFDNLSVNAPSSGSGPYLSSLTPSSGIIGTQVTINGINFGGAQGSSTVTFNGVSPQIVSWSPSQVTAQVAAGTRSGQVQMTVNGIQTNTLTFTLPNPQVTGFSPSHALAGTQFAINGSGFSWPGVTPTVTIGGVTASLVNYIDSQINAVMPPSNPSGQITVTLGGVSGTSSSYFGPCANGNDPNAPPCVVAFTIAPGSLVSDSLQTVLGTPKFSKSNASTELWGVVAGITFTCTNGNAFGSQYPHGPGCYGEDTISFSAHSWNNESTVNITADALYSNDPGVTAQLDIKPLTATVSVNPSVFRSGTSDEATGTVTLNAPTTGIGVSLSASPGGVIQIPSSVSIGSGQSSATFPITVNGVSQPTDVTITATLHGTSTANLYVWPGDNELGRCTDCEGVASNPINLMNGNTWIPQQDYSLPGLAGGIVMERTWNSMWQSSSYIELTGMFGHSWRSTFEERMQYIDPNHTKYWRADGSSWLFNYVGNGWILEAPLNQHASLTFDSSTTLYTLSLNDGTQKIFTSAGYLTRIIDRNGNTTAVTYDASNRISQVTDPAGRILIFNYPDQSTRQVQSIQDSVGVIATYAYDSSARLLSTSYADGSAINYNYDSNSLITSVTDQNGKLLEGHTYDASRRGLSSQQANGVGNVSVAYVATGVTQLTDSQENLSSYSYDTEGNRRVITSITGSGCASCGGRGNSSFAYDASGNRNSSSDALNRVTTSTYDANSNLLTRTAQVNGQNVTWTYTYNSFGQVLTATDPLGYVTTNVYDSKGNLLSTTTPSPDGAQAGSQTAFTYDSKGQLLTITDPLNHTTTLTYTAAGLVQTVTDVQNHVTSYEYDARGNRTAVVDAMSNRTTFAYDSRNRLTQITYPNSTTTSFGYDLRGRRTSVTDGNGRVTQYAYDDADRLTSVTDAQTPTPGITQYAYDTENNLTGITDALGRATGFGYDAYGRVTKTTFPSTLVETYSYDAVGNLLSKTDRKGQTIQYSYDALNRLTQKLYPDSTAVNYTYDNDSRLTQVTDPTGTYGFSYDRMGRLTSTTTQYAFISGRNFTNSYGYDAASNRTGFGDPAGGSTSYGYDTLNRLTTLTGSVAGQFGFGYDALNRRTSLTRPNSVNTSYGYDSLSRLLSVIHQANGTTLDGASYTYDNAGNRLSKTDYLNSTSSVFAYDAVYQLTQVSQGGNATESYSFDAVGNRLSSLGLSPYQYNISNQLTSLPGTTYAYDNNGNMVSKTDSNGTTGFTWDYENRLTSVTLPGGGGTVTFKYDPFGRRIQKSSASGIVNYLYDGANIVTEVDAAGNTLAAYAQGAGIDEPLAMWRAGATSYYEADGLGSVTSLSAGSTLSATYTYDAFGNPTASTGTLTNPFRYTGREWDSETHLYYYRARYYDPSVGRFTSEDAVRFLGGNNFYAYALNQPTTYIDPHGFAPEGACPCSQASPGIDKAVKCCADTNPISADDPGPNPYSPCQTYMKVNAAGMYRWGGNGPWGQIVRGCLLCALKSGASMNDAHHYCYRRATDRTGYWNGFTGFTRAVAGAVFTVGLQVTYPNPNDPTMECLNVK